MNLKETAEKLNNIKGNVRGDIIIGTLSYIHEEKGEEGLKQVKKKIEDLGYSYSLDKIAPLEWYPEALSVMVILSAKEVFGWNNDDIFTMGNLSTRKSFVIRTMMKYFISLEKVFQEASKYWDRYFDFGNLEAKEIDEKKKFIRLAIKGYNFHPDICHYQAGFMLKIAQLALGGEGMDIKETKCFFRGDSYHEYLISWK